MEWPRRGRSNGRSDGVSPDDEPYRLFEKRLRWKMEHLGLVPEHLGKHNELYHPPLDTKLELWTYQTDTAKEHN